MPKIAELTGQRFGLLVAVSRVPASDDARAHWICQCDCGRQSRHQTNDLKRGNVKSCGCAKGRFISAAAADRDGHHMTDSPTYKSWESMKQRCCNPGSNGYERYGGRGIKVCDQWLHSFETFLADMGERPHGKTLDRYPDQDGNYEPSNCRWATPTEQARNTRANVLNEATVTQIRWLASDGGFAHQEIRNAFNIGKVALWRVLTHRTWRDPPGLSQALP